MDPSCRHLAFLLSLGAVPLACTGDDTSTTSDSDTASSTGTATTTATATDTTTGSATETGGTGTDSGTDGTTTTDSTGDETAGETTSETTGETTGGGSLCEDFANFYVECSDEGTYRSGLAYCMAFLDSAVLYGEDCLSAFESLIKCQTTQTCREYNGGLGCDQEYVALETACVPEVGETCAAYGAAYEACDGPDEGLDVYCQQEINGYTSEYGEECGQAVDDYFACLSALDCADLLDETGCEKEETLIDDLCG